MDFTVTPEQQTFFEETRAWAQSLIAPGAAERDREGRWDPALWKALGAQGLAGLPIPEAYGGGGASVVECCLANEAIAEGGHDGGFNLSLGAHWVIGTVPIWLHGSEELKKRWLPGLCDGTFVGSWASTEPESGSDAGSIRTTAVRDGDDWVLNGTKMFITNGPIADVCTVLARTDTEGDSRQGHQRVRRRHPHPGFLRRARAGQARLPLLADRRDRPAGLPGARRVHARPGRGSAVAHRVRVLRLGAHCHARGQRRRHGRDVG